MQSVAESYSAVAGKIAEFAGPVIEGAIKQLKLKNFNKINFSDKFIIRSC